MKKELKDNLKNTWKWYIHGDYHYERDEICKLKISNIEMAIDKEKKYAGRCLNYEECIPNETACIRPHESCSTVFSQSNIGRTVFLTYEEAEKALEEKQI